MTEVLVAVFVLSVGLLGVAGLQLTSLRSNHAAAMRSQATFLAYDIIDRMRANRTAALNGGYALAENAVPAGGTVAGDDLVAWRGAIARTLPGVDINNDGTIDNATGSVARAGNIYTIDIVWGDTNDDPANNNPQRVRADLRMRTQLQN
jgi:type IV pilus assembly protein PilV